MHTILVFGLIISPSNRGLQVTRNNNVALCRDKLALLSGLVLTIKTVELFSRFEIIIFKVVNFCDTPCLSSPSYRPSGG